MIGLLGGTFDPIHFGHLDVARAARNALGLERVLLVPSRLPPHRAAPQASAAHRFAMTAIAVANEQGLEASDLEMDTDGPSFTIDTLNRLVVLGIEGRSVCFITGADAFREIASWKSQAELLTRCHFAVVSRPGMPASDLRTSLPGLVGRMVEGPGLSGTETAIHLLNAATAAVSSTDVRRAVAMGQPLDGLVPGAVAAHIARHRLYQTGRAGDVSERT
jgi:nicotinate-nucleotide adenylyltransferase